MSKFKVDWIDSHRRTLLFGVIISFAIFVGELIYFRYHQYAFLSHSLMGLILLPPVCATAFLFPLVYLSWFKNRQKGTLRTILMLFFWALTIVTAYWWIFLGYLLYFKA
ncbi:MAG: hypothetical protein ACLPX5_12315 [Dissulfurispiraceae bacterium]